MNLSYIIGKKFGSEITKEQIREITHANFIDVRLVNTAIDLAFVAGRVSVVVNNDQTIVSLTHERDDGGFTRLSRGDLKC